MKTRTIYSFATLLAITSLLFTGCAALAPAPTATPTPLPTITFTPTLAATATSTPKPTITLTPTATIDVAATQQVEAFALKVQEYYDAKYVSSVEGTYQTLPAYVDAWAQINYYAWTKAKASPTNFIISSDISWISASPAANSSGCGYVFRLQDDGTKDHYMFFISLKGYVELATNVDRRFKSLGIGTYGNPAQKGSANVVLIVEDSTFRVLVDGKLIKTYTGFAGKLTSGDLAYTIVSGINTSFGTRCTFKNTELWTIIKP